MSGTLGPYGVSGVIDEGTSARVQSRPPGAIAGSTPAEIEQRAIQAARRVLDAIGGIDTRNAIGAFLGDGSFTAGVVVGMGQNLAGGVIQLLDFFRMMALAEYWQGQHAAGFWEKFRAPLFGVLVPQGGMVLASMFWPGFDREAQKAYEEREALIKAVVHAFENPGEVLGHVGADLKEKYEAFKRYREQHTLDGEYRAGKLFGELLLDLLLIVDGVTALARVATKIPGLLKVLPRLERLAPILKRPPKPVVVVKEVAPGPKAVKGGIVRDAINPTGPEKAAELGKSSTGKSAGGKAAERSVWHAPRTSVAARSIVENGIDPAFLNPNSRFGSAFYVAEQPSTSLAEMAHYGVEPPIGIRFQVNNEALKVLDLTNPETAASWGYKGGAITPATQKIGSDAAAAGYNAIRYNSERAIGGTNLAILDDFDSILKPVMVAPTNP